MASELPPAAPITLQQLERTARPLAAGRIELQSFGRSLLPGVKKRLHRSPAGFNAVGTLKQDVVTEHAVIDQGFIAGSGFSLEVVIVMKLHLHAANSDWWTGDLGVELQHNAFYWLDADDKVVLRQLLDRCTFEHGQGRFTEFDCYLRAFHTERLAGAQVEGNAGPAPIVDGQFQRHVSLGRTIGPDARGLAVIRDLRVVDLAGRVLTAHGVLQRFLFALDLEGRQHLALFRAHRMCVEPRRRLHGDQRQQLEQMIRHHVAKRAGLVIEAAAMTYVEFLFYRDLPVAIVCPFPNRPKLPVAKVSPWVFLPLFFPQKGVNP